MTQFLPEDDDFDNAFELANTAIPHYLIYIYTYLAHPRVLFIRKMMARYRTITDSQIVDYLLVLLYVKHVTALSLKTADAEKMTATANINIY